MKKRVESSPLLKFLMLSVLVSVLCGVVYAVVQQHYRQDANDPQIQIAEDMSRSLSKGDTVTIPTPVDISKSLAPFVIITDNNEKIVTSSGTLNGQTVIPPEGSFLYASNTGEDRITWQPAPNARVATVIKPFTGKNTGYVIVGRSLTEVEKRENMLVVDVTIAWIMTLGVSALFSFL